MSSKFWKWKICHSSMSFWCLGRCYKLLGEWVQHWFSRFLSPFNNLYSRVETKNQGRQGPTSCFQTSYESFLSLFVHMQIQLSYIPQEVYLMEFWNYKKSPFVKIFLKKPDQIKLLTFTKDLRWCWRFSLKNKSKNYILSDFNNWMTFFLKLTMGTNSDENFDWTGFLLICILHPLVW